MIDSHQLKTLIKPLDFVIIVIAIVLICLSLFFTFSNREEGSNLIVSTTEGDWIYSLSKDVTVEARGALGFSVIAIHEGHSFFVSSPCDNQLCVHSNPIYSSSQFIACLPNQVFIRVESNEVSETQDVEMELDAIGF